MTGLLDAALLDAHARDDKDALITLYHQAALEAQCEQSAGFFLTHAYIFALERGDTRATGLRKDLAVMGRETFP